METITLENDFQIVYEKPKNVIPIAAIYLFIRQGSVNETSGIRGGSHLIEHMCFKGTSELPNQKILSTKFDEIGAYFNAFTSKYVTCYTVKCDESFVKNCLHILSDMVLNSKFLEKDFAKEQNIVKEETIRNEADVNIRVFKTMDALLYQDSPLAYAVDDISYHKTLFDYETINRLFHTKYRPSNMVLSVVTHIPFVRIKKMLKSTFFTRNIKKDNHLCDNTPILSTAMIPQNHIRYHIIKSNVEKSVNLAIGFRICDMFHTDQYALEVLSTVLAGTMSGRLFVLLREKNAVTYSSKVYTSLYSYTGDFIIYTSADCNKIVKNGTKPGVLPLIINEIKSLIRSGITEKELQIAKGYIKGKSTMSLEKCENQALHNGEHFIMEKYNPAAPSKFIKYSDIYESCIDPVKCSDVMRVIKKYFIKENMAVILSGKNAPTLDRVKSICETVA
jgi:predicted Zn-dependent peptidase